MYGIDDATWTETTIARLRELWSEGISASEIGRRLGISKNAVIGKVHRLELPGRNCPIKRNGYSRPKPTPRTGRTSSRTTLPALQSLQQPGATTAPGARDRVTIRRSPAAAILPAAPPALLRPWQKSQPCCWPIGEPGTSGFRYCEAGSLPGKSYCEEHYCRAYASARQYED